jgi:Ca-activated chloride channel homolog
MTTRQALVALLVLIPAVVVRTQNASFSSKTEAVRVDVLVTDKGQPLPGLVPGDFEVRDNGVPQQIDLVNFEEIPLNVTLALDMSGSVAGERLGRLRAAAGALLAGLKPRDQAALITFSHIVRLGAGLTTDLESVRAALDKARGVGETALVDGIYAGIMVGESDVGRSLLIVFSDGLDTSSWLSPKDVLDIAKRSDVVTYAVSTRSPLRSAFLRDLTSFTGGQLFEVEKTTNLEAVFLGMLEEFRHRYLLIYTPRGVAPDGWHRLTVRVRRNGTVKARAGYLAGS